MMVRRGVIAVLAATIVAGAAAAPATARDAVALQIDPAHTGATSERGLDPPLRLAWSRRFRRPPSYPLIAGGRVFVTVPDGRPFSNGPSRLFALSARSGRTLWSRPVGGDFQQATAAYDGGRVYVGNDEGELMAFAAAGGAPLWRRQLGQAAGDPVAVGGLVHAVVGSSLLAVDGTTGAVRWSAPIEGTASCGPAVSGDRVYAAFVGPHVYAFDRRTGARLWYVSSVVHGGGCDTPAVHRGRLYVRDWASFPHGFLYDAARGALAGRFEADAEPAFHGGLMLALDRRVEPVAPVAALVARDAATGAARWRFRGDGHLQSTPLVVNSTVFVGSGTGRLYGLNARTGRVRWRIHLPEGVSGSGVSMPLVARAPAAGNGLLVVPATRRLVAFR